MGEKVKKDEDDDDESDDEGGKDAETLQIRDVCYKLELLVILRNCLLPCSHFLQCFAVVMMKKTDDDDDDDDDGGHDDDHDDIGDDDADGDGGAPKRERWNTNT